MKRKASGQKVDKDKKCPVNTRMEKKTKPHQEIASGSPAPTGKAQRGDKQLSSLSGSPAPTGNLTFLQVQGGNRHNSKPSGSPAPMRNVTSPQVQGDSKHDSKPPSSPAPKGKAPDVPGQRGDKRNAKLPGSPAPRGNVTSLQVQGRNKHNSKPPSSPALKRNAPHVQSQGGDKHNASLPGSPASSEKATLLDGQGGEKQYASASGSPGSENVATVDGQGGDEQLTKSETTQSIEDLDISGTSVKNPLEDEVRRLKAENHFLKTILDHLHTNLFLGEATPEQELKPPEDIQNDQSILELYTNAQKVERRFQELETKLDIIYTRMSQILSTNAGGKEGKGETPSKDRSNKTATNGHSPEKSPASTPLSSEQSLDLDAPVSKEKNGKESNIEIVSSPMEERSGFAPNLEGGDENTGHRNTSEASDKTSARKYGGESNMYPTERKHDVLERLDEVEEMIGKQKEVIKKLKSDLKEAETNSQMLEEQVESLRMRLSELAGAKYTKDNANVTDLSDLNRPTKLAEEYSELYSNEWSDAFEQQSGRKSKPSEVKIIKKLLDILLAGFKYCKSIKDDQHSGLREIILFPARDKAKNQANEENVEMNEVIVRHLTEAIKRSGEMTGEHIAKVFIKMKETKDMLRKGTESHDVYAQKCVKLCWLMQVQTPPVCIDLTANPGDQFDKNTYREYTKKGSKIDFIVWPPLRLHEGGPLLAKGVAQGK